MKPASRTRSVRLVLVGLAACTALAVSGIAVAASSPPSSINTCTKVNKHGVYGKTKVTTASSCRANQFFQNWNMAASDNDPVFTGFHLNQVSFSGNSPTTIATLTIPTAGNYAMSATMTLNNTTASAFEDACGLTDGTNTVYEDDGVSPNLSTNLALQLSDSISAGGSVSVICQIPLGTGPSSAQQISITAIAGTSVSNSSI